MRRGEPVDAVVMEDPRFSDPKIIEAQRDLADMKERAARANGQLQFEPGELAARAVEAQVYSHPHVYKSRPVPPRPDTSLPYLVSRTTGRPTEVYSYAIGPDGEPLPRPNYQPADDKVKVKKR